MYVARLFDDATGRRAGLIFELEDMRLLLAEVERERLLDFAKDWAYRRPPRGRLLGADDLARLGAVLRQREDENPVCVSAVRLLLLTG